MYTSRILIFFLFFSTLSFGQPSYDDYETCNVKDPSFETLGYQHCQEAEILEVFVSDSLGESLIDTALMMFLEAGFDLEDQENFMDSIGISCEDIREHCFTSNTSHDSRDFFDNLEYMEEHFSVDQNTYDKVSNYINSFKGPKASFFLDHRLSLLQEYLDLAYEIKYTKSEILRDFTGYCEYGDYVISRIANKFCTGNRKHGVAANESIKRLYEIRDCNDMREDHIESIISGTDEFENFQVHYTCSGELYLSGLDRLKLKNNLDISIFDLSSGKRLKTLNNLKPQNNVENIDLNLTNSSSRILIIALKENSRLLKTLKVFCSN